MTKRQLECFIDTYKSGSISEAASHLYVTTQALSKTIMLLEKEIGKDLFIRNGNQLMATQYAEVFFHHACNIIDDFDILEETYNYNNKLIIGSVNQVLSFYFNKMLLDFFASHSDISIEIIEGTNTTITDLLLHNKCEIAFIQNHLAPQYFLCKLIYENEFCCVINKKHPLAQKDVLNAMDYDKLNVAGRGMQCDRFHKYIAYLNSNHIYPNLILESMNDDILLSLARDNCAAALVPLEYAKENIDENMKIYHIDCPKDQVYIARRNTGVISEAAKVFGEFANKWIADNLGHSINQMVD